MSDCTIVTSGRHGQMAVASKQLYQIIVQFDKTIVLLRKLATESIHDYLFCYCPLVGILFEVLRIDPCILMFIASGLLHNQNKRSVDNLYSYLCIDNL